MLKQTAKLVAACLRNSPLSVDELPELIRAINGAVASASTCETAAPEQPLAPAVPVKKSVQPDYIVCLEDGKKLKMLKRHLMTTYGMTPDEYRAKWGLPPDYPMVAPNYAAHRSSLAKESGLGRKPAAQAEAAAPTSAKAQKPKLGLGAKAAAEPAVEPEPVAPAAPAGKPAHRYPASRWSSKATD